MLAGEEGDRHPVIGNDGMQYADCGNGCHEQKPRKIRRRRDPFVEPPSFRGIS